MAEVDYQALFDQELSGKQPEAPKETDYHSLFSQFLDAGKAAMDTPMIPGVPSPESRNSS
jgi:hypothetical protein